MNRQAKVRVNLSALRAFDRRLRASLGILRKDFNVCLVDDRAMRKFNSRYRSRPMSTDVLSFPWPHAAGTHPPGGSELTSFLGDIVISAPQARANARLERHSTLNEIRWLMLHGLLHLLGYDHETDHGEMTAREHSLRARLGINGRPKARRGRRGTAKRGAMKR